eukprot:3905684-Alexandrium_andersonii.AAC.1
MKLGEPACFSKTANEASSLPRYLIRGTPEGGSSSSSSDISANIAAVRPGRFAKQPVGRVSWP